MPIGRKLVEFLGGQNLKPSPERSALIQALQAQTMRNQGRPSASLIESLNIAAAPIMAGLLARREGQARQTQQQRDQAAIEALLAQPKIDPDLQDAHRTALQALLSNSSPEMQGFINNIRVQQAFAEQDEDEPKILAPRQRVVPGRFLPSGKAEERDVFTEIIGREVRNFIIDENSVRTYVSGLSTPPQRVLQGELRPAQEDAINDAEINARNYIDTVEEALQLLTETPDVNTFVAGAASFVNNLQANMTAAARNIGVDFREASLDPGNYESQFDKLGIQNAQLKSLITTLAFQRALAAKNTGQSLSNRDVERFITEIGAQHDDPRAFKRVLVDSAKRTERVFRNTYQVITRTSSDDVDLGAAALEKYVVQEPAQRGTAFPETEEEILEMSPEELIEFIRRTR